MGNGVGGLVVALVGGLVVALVGALIGSLVGGFVGGFVGELVGEFVTIILEHAANVYPQVVLTYGTPSPFSRCSQSGFLPDVQIAYTAAFASLHDTTLPL